MFKKIMVAVLAFAMMFTSNTKTTTVQAAQAQKRSVFSIDAGRKYFSEAQLLQIVEKAYANGYTDVQLILGNDGLRFNLDDMSLTVGDKNFASDDVKKAIKAGNDAYYADPNGNALTETEMNNILSRAKTLGMNIIPVINTPGHMDAILVAMEELGLSDVRFTNEGKQSARTVNLLNDEAVAFCKALVSKYVNYFASKGTSDIFNFGADEYANDVFKNPGWGELQRLNLYDKFINYANDLCAIIKEAGMRPMCFNDGIYYNRKTNFGTFDKDLIISYWTAGWWGFYVAKPEFLAEQGHDILNTNDGWYWVLGNIEDGGYKFPNAIKNIAAKDFNDVPGAKSTTSVQTIGSMQCVWCDFPQKEHDMDRIMQLMDAFATKHADVMERPADYTKVDEAVAKIPADVSNYTEASVAALNKAVAAIDRTLRVSEQAIVDQMAKDIEDAIKGLQLKTADYAKVDAAIAKAEALNKKDYVDFSKVDAAIANVKRNLDITKQGEVDAFAAAIEDAIANLKKVEVVKPSTPTKPQTEKPNTDHTNTGDATNMTLWVAVSVVALGAVFVMMRRFKEN